MSDKSAGLPAIAERYSRIVLRIANCSGFYGDRLAAAKEMVEGGPIDVLTGDYLAELTMAILWRAQRKDAAGGYATSFLTQMEEVLGTCLERGIKIVANAGGLNPRGLVDQLEKLATRIGLTPKIASIEGDDLLADLPHLLAEGEEFKNLETGIGLTAAGVAPVTANAYLGAWPIAQALRMGADVVVTGRVTDAAVVMGPAAWFYEWGREDWNRLAGSLVAGHVIECGAQTTGGNFSFFREVPHLEHIGFPLVEMEADGSFVVTKHSGTGGLVSTETVTAQLLYEIEGPEYLSPDVTARFDTIQVNQIGPDRVAVTGVRGQPPGQHLKVALNYLGGYRNSITFGLCGLDVVEKARLLEEALWQRLGGKNSFAETDSHLIRSNRTDPANHDEALAWLRVTVKDAEADKVGKAFSRVAVELALAHYPGFFMTAPPGDAMPYAVYWPALVGASKVVPRVSLGDSTIEVPNLLHAANPVVSPEADVEPYGEYESVPAPLGVVAGARSGDKGGKANVGVWGRTTDGYRWLRQYLTVQTFKSLIPEAAALPVVRFDFPNLGSLNFVIEGYLGQGVAASTQTDPQAKSLGEYLRAKVVPVPQDLLGEEG